MFKEKVIISTQAEGNKDHIGHALKTHGASILYMPLIEITPIPVSKKKLSDISIKNNYQWLVFTSKNGVNHLFNQLKLDANTKLLPFKTAVFGKRTSKALKEKGFNPDLINLQDTSADLLTDLYPKLKANDKVLLVLGNLASELLEKSLESKVRVERLDVYHTIYKKLINNEILDTIKKDKYDLIVFSSPSGFNSFKYHTTNLINLCKLRIACIGPTTEEAILSAGLKPLVVAKPSGKEGLIKEIESYFNTHSIDTIN